MTKVVIRERKDGSIGIYKSEMKYLGTIVKLVDVYTGYIGNEGENIIFKGEKSKEEAIRKVRKYFQEKDL